MTVAGQDINNSIPPVCGHNSHQHMYVEVGDSGGPVQLRVATTDTGTGHRWRLKLTQYSAPHTAPHLCLQHHTASSGVIASFNQPPFHKIDGGTTHGQYTNRLNYMICVEKLPAHCSVSYVVDNQENGEVSNINHFNIVNNNITDGSAGQMLLMFVTDESEVGTGFRLHFQQNPCKTRQEKHALTSILRPIVV